MIDFLKITNFWMEHRKDWFRVSLKFDNLCKEKFKKYFDYKYNFEYEGNNVREVLGVILLYDQLSRNIFRGSAESYKYDKMVIKFMLNNFHLSNELEGWEKIFFLMPLKHSEDLHYQKYNVKLWKNISEYVIDSKYEKLYERNQKSCEKHFNIIKIYGRFPKRNKILLRENTDDEKLYLLKNPKGYI